MNVLWEQSNAFYRFVRKNAVFVVALVAALATCVFVPFDRAYPTYFDFKTLTSLFCMLLVVNALKNICFFKTLARRIIRLFKTSKGCVCAIIVITYIASMLIANDMALITFLPLAVIILKATGQEKNTAFTFIMMTIAANLGGMLTPFGNPQSLYLYNYFNIPTGRFFAVMSIPFCVSAALIVSCCLVFIRAEPLQLKSEEPPKTSIWRLLLYTSFFVYAILIVFRVVPFWTGLLMIPIFAVLDRKALAGVDYILLLTFCAFFVFAGNLARIGPVAEFLRYLTEKNTLLTGIVSCQVISNVPTAVLLAGFTKNYPALLMAVNIGSCGTLLSSLASLITFRSYGETQPGKQKRFLVLFHIVNLTFLAVLTALGFLLTAVHFI